MGNSGADCCNQMVVKPMKVPGDGCEGTKVTTENVAATTYPKDLQFLSLGFQNRFCYSHHQNFSNPKGNLSDDDNNNNKPWDLLSPWTFLLSLDFLLTILQIFTSRLSLLLFFKSLNLASLVVNLWGKGKAEAKEEEKQKKKKKKKIIIQVKFFGTHTIAFFVISLSHSNKPVL